MFAVWPAVMVVDCEKAPVVKINSKSKGRKIFFITTSLIKYSIDFGKNLRNLTNISNFCCKKNFVDIFFTYNFEQSQYPPIFYSKMRGNLELINPNPSKILGEGFVLWL